jgi:hypothetical protein
LFVISTIIAVGSALAGFFMHLTVQVRTRAALLKPTPFEKLTPKTMEKDMHLECLSCTCEYRSLSNIDKALKMIAKMDVPLKQAARVMNITPEKLKKAKKAKEENRCVGVKEKPTC